MNKKEIIFVLLDGFADWEGAHTAVCLNTGVKPGSPIPFTVKTMSVSKEPVMSIGGFKVLPDYDIDTIPDNYAGVVIVGGMSLFTAEAELIVPLVEKTLSENKLVAAICNGSVFLGKHGFLNNVKHTSNGLDYLKQYAGDKYIGEELYMDKRAVRDGNIVTAGGTSELEFCREVLHALNADTAENVDESYQYYKGAFGPKE